GDVSNATTHMRTIGGEIRRLTSLSEDELYVAAKELQAPYDLVVEVAKAGKLPVTMFTAGGIATPADAAMMMQLGAEGVFVGSGIFKSTTPSDTRKRYDRFGASIRADRRARASWGASAGLPRSTLWSTITPSSPSTSPHDRPVIDRGAPGAALLPFAPHEALTGASCGAVRRCPGPV
ncbi:pyridoxal biosynthesis lyase PdxS, partial [Rhodococcus opacus RKJ300 = JCM 13270]